MAELFISGGIVTALEDAAVAVGRLHAALAGSVRSRGSLPRVPPADRFPGPF